MISNESLGRMLAKMMINGGPDTDQAEPAHSGRRSRMQEMPEHSPSQTYSESGESRPPDPPDVECTGNLAYLEGNLDFFLDLMKSKDAPPVCPSLIRHINNCYRCFEIYSGVMRGFILDQHPDNSGATKGSG